MAVVSISRIQIRRGRKTNLPQLASGEFGWSVDSQELYIGNGAVSEGAPYVGNTKLLSEHDNLFQFANSYSYKSVDGYVQTGDSPNNPVLRTLQDRLDDIVSVRAFGASGDGTDQTEELQRAVDQLYLNAANKGTPRSRVVLHLEAGEYQITSTIYVPPFAIIRGAGSEKTIINAGSVTAFQTVNENSIPGSYANDSTSTTLNQPRNIEISGLTIRSNHDVDGIILQSCKDSIFSDIKLVGTWQLGNDPLLGAAIKMNSLSSVVSSNNNIFENISINGYSEGVYSDYDVKDNTFRSINFENNYVSVLFGAASVVGTQGQISGPLNNLIENCTFDDIYEEGIKIVQGYYNKSCNNNFYNVGNHGGNYGNAQTANIAFFKSINSSDGDYFTRTETLGFSPLYLNNYPYIPEITGSNITTSSYTYDLSIGNTNTYEKILRLPANARKSFIIDYVYASTAVNAGRTGRIEINVDPGNNNIQIVDEFVYTGDSAFSENLRFDAELYDENADTTVDTAAITMLNSTSGDNAKFTYKITTKQ